MMQYVEEVRYAVESLVPLLQHEQEEEGRLQNDYARLTRQSQSGYAQADAIALNVEDPEDVGLATGLYWETYFGADRDRYEVGRAIQDLEARLKVRRFSIDALAGALLQIAKQGLSIVHGRLGACPEGRAIGRQALKTVVWHARNQSMHWEEGSPRTDVIQCFQKLEQDFGSPFADYRTRSLAFAVVQVIGWLTPADVLADLELLA